MELTFYSLIVLVLLYLFLPTLSDYNMATPADLQKLVDNMKRANTVLDKAASDSQRHSVIMDSFEQRLAVNDENMNKIAAYEQMMASMDTGNGGPSLEVTFPATDPNATSAGNDLTSHSTKGLGRHGS